LFWRIVASRLSRLENGVRINVIAANPGLPARLGQRCDSGRTNFMFEAVIVAIGCAWIWQGVVAHRGRSRRPGSVADTGGLVERGLLFGVGGACVLIGVWRTLFG
jgi:hypothetical protein